MKMNMEVCTGVNITEAYIKHHILNTLTYNCQYMLDWQGKNYPYTAREIVTQRLAGKELPIDCQGNSYTETGRERITHRLPGKELPIDYQGKNYP